MRVWAWTICSIILVGCAADTGSDAVGSVSQAALVPDIGTIPYPVMPPADPFNPDPDAPPKPSWDGTLVDLLAADAFALCTPGWRSAEADDANEADRYLEYLQGLMGNSHDANCGPQLVDLPNGDRPSIAAEWANQRALHPFCNFQPASEDYVVLEVSDDAADSSFYAGGTVPERWLPYDLATPYNNGDFTVQYDWTDQTLPNPATVAALEATKELANAATNLCMANRLREQMLTLDVVTMNAEDQRQLLSVIRERAQIAMLQLSLIGGAFSNTPAAQEVVTDGSQIFPLLASYGQFLQSYDPSGGDPTASDYTTGGYLGQLGADLATAVRIHVEATNELSELFVRSASARSSLARMGGAGEHEDVEWGQAGWRGRLLNLLYGGDPLGTPDAGTGSFNVEWGGVAGYRFGWDGWRDRKMQADMSRPEVQVLVGLAKAADVLFLAVDGSSTEYDLPTSANFLWRATEAHLQNVECSKDPTATCDLNADSAELPIEDEYTESVLWQRFQIRPVHAETIVGALSEALPPPGGDGSTRGGLHVSGTHKTELPPQMPSATGTWHHIDPDLGIRRIGIGHRAAARLALGGFHMPLGVVSDNVGPSHGFVSRVTRGPLSPFFAEVGIPNDSMRYLGAVSALAAVRDALTSGMFVGTMPEFWELGPEVVGYIESGIGTTTVAVRPVLQEVEVSGPCYFWERANGTCNAMVQKIISEDPDIVEARVDVTRSLDDTEDIQVTLVRESDLADPNDMKYVASAAADADFVSPTGFSRTTLDTLTWIPAPAFPITPPGLNLKREEFKIQWEVDANGRVVGAKPVLLMRTTETTPRYAVLVDGLELDAYVDTDETRTVGTAPVYRAVDGIYLGYGGMFQGRLSRAEQRHPERWAKAWFDGFGIPINWVPPTNPEVLGGGDDPVAYYLTAARTAAEEATGAVRGAIEALTGELTTESTGRAQRRASRERAAGISKLEQEALCGRLQPECSVEMIVWETPSRVPCNDWAGPYGTPLCDVLQNLLDRVLPTSFPVLPEVAEALAVGAPSPTFSMYSGGSLQQIASRQFTAARSIQVAVSDANRKLVGAHYTQNAALENYNAIDTQLDWQSANHEAMWDHVEWCRDPDNIRLASAQGKGFAFEDSEIRYFLDDDGGWEVISEDSASWSPGPLIAWGQHCNELEHAARHPPVGQTLHNLAAADSQYAAQVFTNESVIRTAVLAIIDAVGELRLASTGAIEARDGLARNNAKTALDLAVQEASIPEQLAISKRYHHYDLWRARALLENARRLSAAARRAIEARYNVDLSEMTDDEPFVAAPALWADEVYEYDLAPPAAVGLSRTPSSDGLYANKVEDYVLNLENFVRGYAVRRPTATAVGDTEVYAITGPAPQASDDSIGNWLFQCEGGGAWLPNPTTLPEGRAVLDWDFREVTAPYANHGYGIVSPEVELSPSATTVLPGIAGNAVDLNFAGGGAQTSPTMVGESTPITVMAWVNLESHSIGSNSSFIRKRFHVGAPAAPWNPVAIGDNGSGELYGHVVINNVLYGLDTGASTGALPLHQWVHVAMTYDGNEMKLFLNGDEVASRILGGDLDWGEHSYWHVGVNTNGLVDSPRVESVVYSQEQLAELYATELARAEDSHAWHFTESAAPFASEGRGPSTSFDVAQGTPVAVSSGPFGTAVDFDGASSLVTPATTAGEVPAEATLSAWVMLRSVNGGLSNKLIMKTFDPSAWVSPFLSFGLIESNGTAKGAVAVGGTLHQVASNIPLPLNEWTHLAVTFDGTTLTIYQDGVDHGSFVVPGSTPAPIDWGQSGPWSLGGNAISGSEYVDAQVANVRLAPVARSAEHINVARERGLGERCYDDGDCELFGDCCEDRLDHSLLTMCEGEPPRRAQVQFNMDPWGRIDDYYANPPYTERFNVRWGRLAVNLVGTGIRDCSRSFDPLSCYGESFIRFNLVHGGPTWMTDYLGEWRSLAVPQAQIEGGKALTIEEWLDPIVNSWNQPYVANVARREFLTRPVSGGYVLELELPEDIRLDRLERVQLLAETNYWVREPQ